MNYKKIVAEAWHFTQENKYLIFWYGAIPSFFGTLVGIGYLLYQYFAFLSSPLFQNWPRSFLTVFIEQILDYLRQHQDLVLPTIISVVIGVICYFIIPVFCEGALIQSISRKKNGQDITLTHGISQGMKVFLPLFEYKLLLRTFSIWSVLPLLSTMIRNFGIQSMNLLLPILIVVLVAAVAVAILLVYAEYFLVIDGRGVFESIGKSMNLVVKHLEETLLLIILMIFIGLRILVQIFFVFLIPVVAAGIVYLFTAINLPGLAFTVAGIISVLGLFLASYLNGTIHVFAVAVWTFTFLKFSAGDELTARDIVTKE